MYDPCVSCARLSKCTKVTPVMLEDGDGCSLHEPSHEGVVRARIRVVYDFGAFAICKKNPDKGPLPMTVGTKRYLRGIAINLKLIPPRGGSSFRIEAADLIAMISDFTTADDDKPFEDIGEKDIDELKALLADLKENGAPAGQVDGDGEKEEKKAPAKKPRKAAAKKAPAKKEEPEEDEDEEPEEKKAPAKKPRARKAPAKKAPAKGKKAPSRRAPAKAKKGEDTAAPAAPAAPAADLSKIEDMVTTIGTMLDKNIASQAKKTKDLEAVVTRVLELVESIDGYLTFTYNQEVEPGNEIESLSDVDWS